MSRAKAATRAPHHQSGIALILLLTLLVLVATGALISRLKQNAGDLQNEAKTTAALALAKQALIADAIAWARSAGTDPGYFALPCPDTVAQAFPNEGSSEGACGARGVTTIGKFPWRSLGSPPLRDSSGECLWYILSGEYKQTQINTQGTLLNHDKNGQLEIRNRADIVIAGTTPQERAVAAIISPGGTLPGQNRTALANNVDHCGGTYDPADYLETLNGIDNATPDAGADTITQLITSRNPTAEDQFNDRIAWISRQEIADAFNQNSLYVTRIDNLLTEIATCLANFAQADAGGLSRLPWAAPLALTDYRDNSEYDDLSGTHFGRIPFDTDDSAADSGGNLPATLVPGPSNCFNGGAVDNYRNHWKDHLFLVIAGQHDPTQAAPNCSGNCLQVDQTDDAVDNPTGDYAAIVIFADRRQNGQVRDAPPPGGDLDTKQLLANYLEGNNLTSYPDAGGDGNYQQQGVNGSNDRLFCVNPADLLPAGTIVNRCP